MIQKALNGMAWYLSFMLGIKSVTDYVPNELDHVPTEEELSAY